MLNKALEIRRNPSVNGLCDEDPVPRMTVTNCLQSIGSRPITFDNALSLGNQALLSHNKLSMLKI